VAGVRRRIALPRVRPTLGAGSNVRNWFDPTPVPAADNQQVERASIAVYFESLLQQAIVKNV